MLYLIIWLHCWYQWYCLLNLHIFKHCFSIKVAPLFLNRFLLSNSPQVFIKEWGRVTVGFNSLNLKHVCFLYALQKTLHWYQQNKVLNKSTLWCIMSSIVVIFSWRPCLNQQLRFYWRLPRAIRLIFIKRWKQRGAQKIGIFRDNAHTSLLL